MKKTLLIVGIIVALIFAIPVINLVRWTFQSKKPMNIILVDKTVPNVEREKHKSFSWVLTNERFVKKDSRSSYSYRKDYYGFVPKRPLREKMWEKNDYRLNDVIKLAESNDAVYFADTYGVFFNDWFKGINKSRKSRMLYGGFNNNDFLLVKEMKDRNKLVIMEYNSFDFPTIEYYSVRAQEKMDVTFGGWTGKHFSSLDSTSKDFPAWMTAMYRKEHKKPWTFNKPGIVFLREKNIIVLEEGTHLKNAMPSIITDSLYRAKYSLPEKVAFDGWFDVINPKENNVISKFSIETTPLGDTLLMAKNLLNLFPAVTQEKATQRVFYFSGDFANHDIPFWTARFKGIDKLRGVFYSEKHEDTRRFFWFYYRPLINGIFTEYYEANKK